MRRSDEQAEQRQGLSSRATAQIADEQGRHARGSCAERDGGEAQSQQPAAELIGDSSEPGNEERMIDLAEGEVATALDELQLVPVVAVARHEQEVDECLQQEQQDDKAEGGTTA